MQRRVVNFLHTVVTASLLILLNTSCLGPFLIPPSSFKQPLTCPLHHERTRQAWVPIQYGLPAPAYPREAQYRELYFPCANQSVRGGCSPTPVKAALVRYCEECRATENDWKERMAELKEQPASIDVALNIKPRPCRVHRTELQVGVASVYQYDCGGGIIIDYDYTASKLFPLANTRLFLSNRITKPYETKTHYCPDCRVAQEEWKRAGEPLLRSPYNPPESLGPLLMKVNHEPK